MKPLRSEVNSYEEAYETHSIRMHHNQRIQPAIASEILYMDQYCLIIQRFPCMHYKTNFRTYSMSFVSCCFKLSFPSEALTILPFVIFFAIFLSPSLNDLPVVYHCIIARQIASSMCNCHLLIMKLHEYTFVPLMSIHLYHSSLQSNLKTTVLGSGLILHFLKIPWSSFRRKENLVWSE